MQTLRILSIEDVEADFLLLARHIRVNEFPATLHWVRNTEELETALTEDNWDLILSDYKIPGLDFLDLLHKIKQRLPLVPLILVSGSIGEETAVDLLKKGVDDFVLKDHLLRLVPAITRSLNEKAERRKRREVEVLFQSIIDNANSAIWVKDLEGKVLVANRYTLEMLGKSEKELLGKTIHDLTDKATACTIAEQERQILSSGRASEQEESFLFPQGQRTLLSTKFPMKDETGNIRSLGAICSDITRIKQAEAQLREQEAQFRRLSQEYRTLLNNVPDGIVHLSPDFHILWVNTAAQQMFNIEEKALIGQFCYTAFWQRTTPCPSCPVSRSCTTLHNEVGTLLPEGQNRELEIRAVPVVNETQELDGVIEIIRDITAHRMLEAQFRQAQKMESIGTLAGGIAHDFNNILSAILGYAEIALEVLEEQHPATSSVRTIQEAGIRAAHLTKDLLMFSRKQVSHKELVDLNVLIARIEKFIRRVIGEDIQFETRLVKRPLFLLADSHQIDQVLMNFATNARDAMPEGGLFTISTEFLELDQHFIAGHGFGSPGPHAVITVTDTGRGMDAQTVDKIFEPFFTTKEMGKGTGLGLAVVYGIILDHQGNITVASEPGKGTTLRLYFPLIQQREKQPATATVQKSPVNGQETILLAEDDWSVRELFAHILSKNGYTVIQAINGEEAVRCFTQQPTEIDLVLMDLVMPRLNGKQALTAIQQRRPDIKALFLSGYAPENIQHQELLDLQIEVLQKPLSPQTLLLKVRSLLDGSCDRRTT